MSQATLEVAVRFRSSYDAGEAEAIVRYLTALIEERFNPSNIEYRSRSGSLIIAFEIVAKWLTESVAKKLIAKVTDRLVGDMAGAIADKIHVVAPTEAASSPQNLARVEKSYGGGEHGVASNLISDLVMVTADLYKTVKEKYGDLEQLSVGAKTSGVAAAARAQASDDGGFLMHAFASDDPLGLIDDMISQPIGVNPIEIKKLDQA
ncbi:MAG: hypothetical protein WAM82_35700 [Thermoanaerobaculia bacterium]